MYVHTFDDRTLLSVVRSLSLCIDAASTEHREFSSEIAGDREESSSVCMTEEFIGFSRSTVFSCRFPWLGGDGGEGLGGLLD